MNIQIADPKHEISALSVDYDAKQKEIQELRGELGPVKKEVQIAKEQVKILFPN